MQNNVETQHKHIYTCIRNILVHTCNLCNVVFPTCMYRFTCIMTSKVFVKNHSAELCGRIVTFFVSLQLKKKASTTIFPCLNWQAALCYKYSWYAVFVTVYWEKSYLGHGKGRTDLYVLYHYIISAMKCQF